MGKLTLAPMEAWDTVHVFPMLATMAAEEARPYPRQTPDDLKRAQSWLLDQIGRPNFGGFVVRDGHKAKGVCWGRIESRPFTQPAQYLEGSLIYVAPSHRKRGVAVRLLTALLTWGRSQIGPDCVLECTVLPDMPAHQMWLDAGFRPVCNRLAWIDEDGQARKGVPLAPPDHSRESRAVGGGA